MSVFYCATDAHQVAGVGVHKKPHVLAQEWRLEFW